MIKPPPVRRTVAGYQFESTIVAEPVTFQGAIAQALTTPSTSRDALASEASDGSAPLGKTLRNGFARVVNVEAYGAVPVGYAVTPAAEQYAANDAAFAAAFQAAVAEGGTLYIPPGYWPVNKVVWDASGTVDVQIKASTPLSLSTLRLLRG